MTSLEINHGLANFPQINFGRFHCLGSTGSPFAKGGNHSSSLDNYTWKGVTGLVMKFHAPFYLTGPGQTTKNNKNKFLIGR